MRPITVILGPMVAASATAAVAAQTLGAAGPLTLNGGLASNGVATFDVPRRLGITSAGNDSGLSWTVTGTTRDGVQSEVIAGANAGTTMSALDYKTITSIVSSGATAGNVTAGTLAYASSQWIRLDEWADAQLAGQVAAYGTFAWTLEQTFDDPNSPTNPVAPALTIWTTMALGTSSQPFSFSAAPIFARLTMTSGTGYARATLSQFNVVNL